MNPLVVIPSRLSATRLPGKPLAEIDGEPMIVHVWRRAVAASAGPVLVACGDAEIAAAVRLVSGTVVMTDPALPTGSDRVCQAVERVDPDRDFDVVVNLQGDMPTLDPALVRTVLKPLEDPSVDIATLAVEITDPDEIRNPNVVKVAVELDPVRRIGRALYFSRAPIPSGDAPRYHHLGIYAYRRAALGRFVALKQSALEIAEKLEQLRALANGMRIDVAIVDTIPLGVDTPADLERARALIGARH
jgi:3-deoxy-manno-octulosonate cytidylyltransferase (CMP-KDO synthetase)